ncbi:MAG: glycosyltransferase [Arenicellales bacterium]|nr:glycosyltransferase [Arenicellales bacterium]
MNNPPVTVLMSVYNGARYLGEAIDSILGQTYRDFEFLIIDDGSTDDSVDIINGYQDPRIRLQQHPNRGLAESLRQGVIDARGDIIVRADQDDVSHYRRVEEQVAYLDQRDSIGLVRTLLEIINANGATINRCTGETSLVTSAPRWWFLWRNIGSHASAAIRKSVLLEHNLNYRPGMDGVEDFDLWSRMLCHTGFGVIDKPLVKYRVHATSLMQTVNKTVQQSRFALVIQEGFESIGMQITASVAKEIAILSGQTLINPVQYHYAHLINHLHIIAGEASRRMEARGEHISEHLKAIQLLEWACYIAPTSMTYALRLLSKAVHYHPRIILSKKIITLSVNLIKRTRAKC